MPRKRTQPAVTAPIEDVDLPPDRHPARRPILVLLLLAMLVLIVRAGWGWIAERRLKAITVDLQRRGLLDPDQSSVLNDSQWDVHSRLEHAADEAVLSVAEVSACWNLDSTATVVIASAVKARAAAVRGRANCLADVRRARRLSDVRWRPIGTDLLAEYDAARRLDRLRGLAQLLQFAFDEAHSTGDDHEAVELLRDMLFVGRAAARFPSSIALPVSTGIEAITMQAIDPAGLGLGIGAGPKSATTIQVRALADELLDDSDFHTALSRHERIKIAQCVRWIAQCRNSDRQRAVAIAWTGENAELTFAPPWANVASARIAGPFYALRGAQELQHEAAIASAIDDRSFVSTCNRLPERPRAMPRSYLFGADWVECDFGQPYDPRLFLKDCFLVQTMRHLAAAQFAIELYSLEHHGQLPPSVDALVPAYLPAVPADLFATGGAPIKYVPAATQPFVYSVGENGVDDFAAGKMANTDGWSYEARLRAPDLIWYVSPPHASTRPAAG